MSLTNPDIIRERLAQRWRNQRGRWLLGEGQWPLGVGLGAPTQRQARDHWPAVEAWIEAWRRSPLASSVDWQERQWPGLGRQTLPVRLSLATPAAVAEALGRMASWQRLSERFMWLTERWPSLTERLAGEADWLESVTEEDLVRLTSLLAWLEMHPRSGLYPRQIPLAGMNTKWLETRRGRLLRWWQMTQGHVSDAPVDFHTATGLRPPPLMVPLKVLDNRLATRLGGLQLMNLELEELVELDWQPQEVLVVENQQTGWALEPREGSVAIFGLGMGIEKLAGIAWLARAGIIYWGDIDTHGFAILDRLRSHYPEARSALMDQATLLAHRELCVTEPSPTKAALTRLTPEETEVYQCLMGHHWGDRLRLEQERLPWDWVRMRL